MHRKISTKKFFDKKDITVVNSDWDGTETYWTATGNQVYTTTVGVDTSNTAVIRFLESSVYPTYFNFDLDFPDDDSYSTGSFYSYVEYPTITKREIHIFDKDGPFPKRIRMDVYNGATLLCQYYKFQVTDDIKVLKYGIRIRTLVAPSNFELDYSVSDDQYFESMGLVIELETQDFIADHTTVAGKTYYPSMPRALIPGGMSQIGYASDSSARLIGLVALVVALIAVLYATLYIKK